MDYGLINQTAYYRKFFTGPLMGQGRVGGESCASVGVVTLVGVELRRDGEE
jgi:hypothetical protein